MALGFEPMNKNQDSMVPPLDHLKVFDCDVLIDVYHL